MHRNEAIGTPSPGHGGDYSRLQSAFADAIELDGDARAAFLEDLGRHAPELAAAVLDLLRIDDALQGARTLRPTLIPTPGSPPDEPIPAGTHLGAFVVRAPLGEGGMGTVYRAERADGTVSQQVAIKVLRRPWLGPDGLGRFRSEAQILARLEHPGIARLIDVGETAIGAPFLTMELVPGTPITEHCDAAQGDIDARIRLFVRACDAVAFAHRNLVVHRDLKPQNVLVTDDGHVKLLDFGIAASLRESPGVDGAERTGTLGRVFSPAYAAPEQIEGKPATVAVDIHGLGVVLYILLTGTHPFPITGPSPRDTEDAVLHQTPLAPSRRRLSDDAARARGVASADRLRRQLRGDLDSIVLKALRKSPTARYGTVEQLCADLDRFLAGRPVRAREGRLPYRAGKLLRRRWRSLTVATAIGLAGVIGLRAFHVQAVETRHQRDRARFVTDFMVSAFEAADPTQSLGADVTAAQILDQSLRQLEAEDAQTTEATRELLLAIARVQASLGLRNDARATVERAARAFEPTRADRDLETRLLITRTALAVQDHELDEARALARDALAYQRLSLAQRLRLELLLAQCAFRESHFEDAHDRLAALLPRLSELDSAAATSLGFEIRGEYGRTFEALGRYPEALAVYETIRSDRQQTLPAQHPGHLDSARRLANLYSLQGRVEDFRRMAEEILTRTERLYGPDSLAMGPAFNVRGTALAMTNDRAGAVEQFERSLEVYRRHHGDRHPQIAMGSFNVALIASPDPAFDRTTEAHFERSLEVGAAVWPEHHRNLHLFRTMYALFLNERARFEDGLAQATAALANAEARPEFKAYDVYALAELAHAVATLAIAPSAQAKANAETWLEACASFPPDRRTKVQPQADIAERLGVDVPEIWLRGPQPQGT